MGKSAGSGKGHASSQSNGSSGYGVLTVVARGYGLPEAGYNLAVRYDGRSLGVYLSNGSSSQRAGKDKASQEQFYKSLLDLLYKKQPYVNRLEKRVEPPEPFRKKNCPTCGQAMGGNGYLQGYSLN